MLRIAIVLLLGAGWHMLHADDSVYVDCAPHTTYFNCPIKGCTLECKRADGEIFTIEKIQQLKMTSYSTHTLFVADMGMSSKRSVIIQESDLFCQVLDHK